jgi:hypothetical protein
MTDLQARSTDDVLQEIERVGEVVDTARRVILVGGGHRSFLIGQLSERLKGLGLVVTVADPADIVESSEPVGPLLKTFADILACPSLSHLFGDGVEPARAILEAPAAAEVLSLQIDDDQPALAPEPVVETVLAPLPDPERAPVPDIPYRTVLMGYPETWTEGDVFEDHPRYTLMHLRRKWVLVSFDADGVELGSPNTTSTDLITLEAFQSRYVFHSHAQTSAE